MSRMAAFLGKLMPRLNFICIHYVWILFCSLLSFPVLYSYGNLEPVDAFFFGCSGSTESGLNTVDVKNLKIYQQVYIYVIPIITNLMFINAMVVVVRLYWFRQHLKGAAERLGRRSLPDEEGLPSKKLEDDAENETAAPIESEPKSRPKAQRVTTITFGEPSGGDIGPSSDANVCDEEEDEDEPDAIKPVKRTQTGKSHRSPFHRDGPALQAARSIEKAANMAFVLGGARPRQSRSRSRSRSVTDRPQHADLPHLSRQVTIGRNSNFYNLTEADREKLGGIEYRALKLLAKFVFAYFIGLHMFGVICLLPWIHNADSKYTDWLDESGVGWTWWAFYSAQTMVNNLGFTLTPDSMATFKDATWPMLVMTFLAFAGNTCYPVLLRLVIWTTSKLVPQKSQTRETIQFLLDHPRRCYTLLFPSRPTRILFGIVFLLNFVDVVLIIALDLDNPAVSDLPMGPRMLSALFQAASSRHTGTSTLNLANVNPAVQFSLLTMMYIAIFPIAISIRASNTDEEQTLGIWSHEGKLDERNGVSYIMVHVRNQLTFDLWYIFLGTFLVCIVESERIMDPEIPSFSVFPVLFEVTSAYANVGLSLGGPSGAVSMVGHYQILSKLIICAMMIRGRHRGLPYAIDRAINLPSDQMFTPSDTPKLDQPQRKSSPVKEKFLGP